MSTLVNLCLKEIVRNFDEFISDADTVIDSKEKSISFERQLQFLQRVFSEELVEMISLQNKFSKKNMNFLVNPYLKKWDVFSTAFDVQFLVDKLSSIGETVTSFSMVGRTDFTAKQIEKMVSLMPNVEELNFVITNCNDSVLQEIGQSCKLLHTLDVSATQVTSKGIEFLYPKDHEGNFGKNNTLLNLTIDNHHTSHVGVIFALDHFPALNSLKYDSLAGILYEKKEEMDCEVIKSVSMPTYNLTSLKIIIDKKFNIYFDIENLKSLIDVCAMLCPNVTELDITQEGRWYDSDDLIACTKFLNVQNLCIAGFDSPHDAITNFLECRGKKLRTAEFLEVTLCLPLLTKYCPYLVELTLCDTIFFETPELIMPLQHLERITLASVKKDEEDSWDNILPFLSSPNLKSFNVKLQGYMSVDDLLLALAKNECRKTLTEVSVSEIYADVKTFKTLVTAASQLNRIHICNFKDTTIYTSDFKQTIERMNANISVVLEKDLKSELFNLYENLFLLE